MHDNSNRDDEERRLYWEQYWKDAREGAQGRWISILGALAPQLGPALDHEGRRHTPCPVHGGTDGFRFFKEVAETGAGICNTCGQFHDGFAMLQWVNGWSARTAVEEVVGHLNGGKPHAKRVVRPVVPKAPKYKRPDNESLRVSLNRAWMRTVSLKHPIAEPARLYLARRGISMMEPNSLRFHPELAYHDGERISGYYPAIVAAVIGVAGNPVTLHRTFLTHDGFKADVESPKKMMMYPDDRNVMGGAIHLFEHGRVLGVAEGIETAFAATQGSGIPTWPTVNAAMLENFVPPKGVEQLIVFSDKDRPTVRHPAGHGQEAAKKLAMRAWEMGIKTAIITPKGEIPEGEKSLDWLDILKRDGSAGFPSLESVRRAMLRAA